MTWTWGCGLRHRWIDSEVTGERRGRRAVKGSLGNGEEVGGAEMGFNEEGQWKLFVSPFLLGGRRDQC